MLHFDSIQLENFGPYKGHQEIKFPQQSGVGIVYGENMRGKTSLLNAIRWALFGEILGRGEREISPEEFINWESKEEGNHSFKVTLEFEFEGEDYELIREFRPKTEGIEPRSAEEYIEDGFLRENGTVLGPEEQEQRLNTILPRQISRFFLFDGELLQQYQDLLVDQSEMGDQIRRAIERILGVPVLKNGRADLRTLLDEAESAVADAASKKAETEELGKQIQATQNRLKGHRKEVDKLESERDDLVDQRKQKRAELKKIENVKKQIERRESLEAEVNKLEEQLEKKEEELEDVLADGWYAVLDPVLQNRLEELEEQREKLQQSHLDTQVALELAQRLETAIEDGTCPVCDQDLEEADEDHLTAEISSLRETAETDGGSQGQEYDDVVRSIGTLRDVQRKDPSERINGVLGDIAFIRADIASNKDDIDEINQNIDESEAQRTTSLRKDEEKLTKKIGIKEEAIESEKERLEKVVSNLDKLQAKLDRMSEDSFKEEKKRRTRYEDLFDLFDKGVNSYRDELRERVEQDASDIFLELTTEPEYERLEINDNYGLTIVHQSGDRITVRSSGAEHVVALALIGALQNNAPLKGPIIMDSPFGRLDSGHVRNVVEALPNLTDQVLLLVYRDELDQEEAREILGGQLRKEYSMRRVSARHTELVVGGELHE